jgi:hypothetical protein
MQDSGKESRRGIVKRMARKRGWSELLRRANNVSRRKFLQAMPVFAGGAAHLLHAP